MVNNEYVWHNGNLVRESQVNISLKSQSLNYGLGIFEGLRSHYFNDNVIIFRLEDHLKRLYGSFDDLGFDLESLFKFDDCAAGCKDVLRKNNLKDAYIRPIAYFGDKSFDLDFDLDNLNLAIFGKNFDMPFVNPICVGIADLKKDKFYDSVHIKSTGSYFKATLQRHKLRGRGFDDALYLDSQNRVIEGVGSSIFFIDKNKLITPRVDNVLDSITRMSVIEFAEDLGYGIEQRDVDYSEISNFDSAFFTGTAFGIIPINRIEDIKFDVCLVEPISKKYKLIVRGQDLKYKNWLTFVD